MSAHKCFIRLLISMSNSHPTWKKPLSSSDQMGADQTSEGASDVGASRRRPQFTSRALGRTCHFKTRPLKYASEFHDFRFSRFHQSQMSLKITQKKTKTNDRKTFIISPAEQTPRRPQNVSHMKDFAKWQNQQKVGATEEKREARDVARTLLVLRR